MRVATLHQVPGTQSTDAHRQARREPLTRSPAALRLLDVAQLCLHKRALQANVSGVLNVALNMNVLVCAPARCNDKRRQRTRTAAVSLQAMSRTAKRASAFPRQAFDRAASRYDDHAALINEVGKRLLERLDGLNFAPTRILDLGCATGHQCLALRERFPHARIIGLDPSGPMLAQARRKRGRWRRRFELVAGALPQLPLAADSIDLVYANLSLHHCQQIDAALAGTRRVLRPGGLLLVSVPGMDTLKELRLAWHRVDPEALRVMPFTDAQRLGTALTQAGFAEPVIDTDWLQSRFPRPGALLEMLKGSGFVNQHPQRPRGLTTARLMDRLLEALSDPVDPERKTRVSWEAVYASAWAPEHGQPLRIGGVEEVSIPIDRIPVRRRDP